jgi:hypothetical protein
MKWTIPVLMASLAACTSERDKRVAIYPAPEVVAGVSTGLQVPASCPVYAPGGGDVDTPEAPFPEHVTIMCAIDDAGGTYGLVTGDAGPAMAVVPGNHELGFYIGFDATAGFTPDQAILDGPAHITAPGDPSLLAFAAPTNVQSTSDCCPESHPDARLPPRTVAVSDLGWLISLGTYDTNPTQVAIDLNTFAILPPGSGNLGSYWTRFYVNGAP